VREREAWGREREEEKRERVKRCEDSRRTDVAAILVVG
jgi:hypothetical protein